MYTTCSPHVLQKEELLTKIYLYRKAAKANEKSEGFLADCYFNYVDVGVYGLPREIVRPNWINVVREPISRYVSHFYYMARDWRMQNKVLAPEDAKVSLQSINLKVSTFFLDTGP